ncbi:unnamed protein product, partial [Rotaria sp. Silwood2]
LKRRNESGSLVPIGPQPPYKQARISENNQQIVSTHSCKSKLAAPIYAITRT